MSNAAVADHALLSDRHSVDRSGSVEWVSVPRFNSLCLRPAVGTRCGALKHFAEWGLDKHPALPGPDASTGDHVH